MKILFLGAFASDSLISRYPNEGLDKYKVSQFLIKNLSAFEKVYTITAPDLASFPSFPKIFLKAEKGKDFKMVSSLNIPVIKSIWKIIVMLIASIKCILKNDITHVIIPYIVYKHVLVARILQLLFRNLKVTVIIPDIFFISRKSISFYLNRWSEKAVLKFDSYVLYTEHMKNYLGIKGKHYLVMEGILDTTAFNIEDNSYIFHEKNTIKVIYAGSLYKQYGILRLLESMKYIQNSDINLLLYGNGDAVEDIKKASLLDSRIQYMGWIPKNKVFDVMKSADILINPRSEEDGSFTEFSCPSKIMEYLLSGTPSIICPLSGIPKDYYPYFELTDGTSIDMALKIQKLSQLTPAERTIWTEKCRSFIIKKMDIISQTKKLLELLKES